ncbi:MAG: amidase [Bryobacteraceae bacterium]
MAGSLPEDLYFAGIKDLNHKLQSREISAVELVRAFSERLETIGPRYNAIALSLARPAAKEAKDIDGDLKRQRFRGPLQGIPYGAKDLLAVAKQPTTWGARPYAQQVFDEDATVIKKLQKPNAVLIGKLAMIELAGGPDYNSAAASYTGPGLNPWDPTRWSGGSSSGSGIAVAAGLVTFALGSETSGSILCPAAFCGVTGLRPTYGLVSRHGAMALSWTLDKIGPIARSAEDCGLVLEAIAGGDGQDPGSAGKSFYYAPQFTRDLKMVKLGIATEDIDDWAEPAARPAFQAAYDVIRSIGLDVAEAKLPHFDYDLLIDTIISAEAASIFEPLIASGKVDELQDAKQIAALKAAIDIPAKDYLKAMRVRSLIQNGFRDLFAEIDVLLAPAFYDIAPKINLPFDQQQDKRPTPTKPGLSALIPAANMAGLPALCLPCGFANGMPVGIQLVGRPFTENLLLTIGREFQARTDWHKRRPPVAAA